MPRELRVDGRSVAAGYVEAVATAPARQGEGLGTLAMQQLGWVLGEDHEMGALSTGAHAFYERLGWERWQGPTFVRTGEQLVRTEDEDDGIMVLRFGPSQETDLSGPISCDSRSGDDW